MNSDNYPELNQPVPRRTVVGIKGITTVATLVILFAFLAYLAVGRDLIEGRIHDKSWRYGLELVFACAVGLGPLIFRHRNDKWLMKWGSIAQARIVEEKEYKRQGRWMAVTYEFTDTQGNKVTGTRKYLPTRDTTRESWRDMLRKITVYPVVLFNPLDSDRNILYLPAWGFYRIK